MVPAGRARDLDGPTFDSSPQGSAAFHTLRDYVPGDERRHIHWRSTARTDPTHRPPHNLTQRSWNQMAASEQEILAGLAEIVNEETGIATEDVQLEKSFTDDLDIDSLSMMTIVVNAEEKFGVRIPDDDVKNLSTVGDAVSYIAKASA